MTQASLQKKCGWGDGTSGARIGHYETEVRTPDLGDIQTIADALEVRVEWLLCGVGTMADDYSDIEQSFRNTPEFAKELALRILKLAQSNDPGTDELLRMINQFLVKGIKSQ